MRTTIRLDGSLLRELAETARREKVSMNRLTGRLLHCGLRQDRAGAALPRRFRERPCRMGQPRVDLTKALSVAAALEDAEVGRELAARR